MYIFPHEFLCLTANSHSRLDLIQKVYKPDWKDLKKKSQLLYDFKGDDLKEPGQPYQIYQKKLENQFFRNFPIRDEGQAIANKEAGLHEKPNKQTQQILLNEKKAADYNLPKKVLKDAIIGTNGYRDKFNLAYTEFQTGEIDRKGSKKGKRSNIGKKGNKF